MGNHECSEKWVLPYVSLCEVYSVFRSLLCKVDAITDTVQQMLSSLDAGSGGNDLSQDNLKDFK